MAELKSTIAIGKLTSDRYHEGYTLDYTDSISDLFIKFEGRRIKITIEELEDQMHDQD